MNKTYISMYHYVRPIANSKYKNIKGLELDLFKAQVQFFLENKFSFITSKDIINNNIPNQGVLLTFDDGYIDHYKHVFPLLKKNNIKGIFSMPAKIIKEKKVLDVNKIHYILACSKVEELLMSLNGKLDFYRGREFDFPENSELYNEWAKPNVFDSADVIYIKRVLQVALPERLREMIVDDLFREYVTDDEPSFVDSLYLNYSQVREMKDAGMEFAYHGYDHRWLNKLTKEQIQEDIDKAQEVFDGIFSDGWGAAYPYGGYNDDLIHELKIRGAKYGLTTDFNVYNPDVDDIFRIPRLDTNDFPPKSNNYIKY